MKHLIILLSILSILLHSCAPKYYRYLQDSKEFFDNAKTDFSNQPPDYKIHPFDILYIRIATNNEEISRLFNTNMQQYFQYNNQNYSFSYLSDYCVSDSGYIRVPILGKFSVANKTLAEVQSLIQEKTDYYLKNAVAVVKLVSFKITFLGEVGMQGTKTFYQDKVNILEAFANAGGITDYGDKRNIMLVRPTETGTKVFRVDLTKRDLLENHIYHMAPNDILIVEPIKFKTSQLAMNNWLFYLSAVTSSLTALALIMNALK